MYTSAATMKNSMKFLKKLKIERPYDPAIYVFIRRKKHQLKKMYAPSCSLQHCLQQLRHDNNLSVHQWRDKVIAVCIYTQLNIIQLQKEENRSSHGSTEMNLTSFHEDPGSVPGLAQ